MYIDNVQTLGLGLDILLNDSMQLMNLCISIVMHTHLFFN